MSDNLFIDADFNSSGSTKVRIVRGKFDMHISNYVLNGKDIRLSDVNGVDAIAYVAARSAHTDNACVREAGIACLVCNRDGSLLYSLDWRTEVMNITRAIILGCHSVAKRCRQMRVEMHVADCCVIDNLGGAKVLFSIPNIDMRQSWAKTLAKHDVEVIFINHNDYHSNICMRNAFSIACTQACRIPYWQSDGWAQLTGASV